MSTTAMWLLLAVVVVAIVFGSVLYKRTFTTKELALTGRCHRSGSGRHPGR